jgi:hypothetical protein
LTSGRQPSIEPVGKSLPVGSRKSGRAASVHTAAAQAFHEIAHAHSFLDVARVEQFATWVAPAIPFHGRGWGATLEQTLAQFESKCQSAPT